jgi:kynurenine formamidase
MIDITIRLEKDHEAWKWLDSQEYKLANAGHIGTHIDVYEKSDIPIEYFKTIGVLIDCTNYYLEKEIGIEVLRDVEIRQDSFVIFKTDIQRKYPYGSDVYINQHYELSWELINYLLEQKVCFIGIDCAGIRRGKEHFRADVKAERNRTFVIENLDLRNLTSRIFFVYTMWINNPFSTGLSARVLVDAK